MFLKIKASAANEKLIKVFSCEVPSLGCHCPRYRGCIQSKLANIMCGTKCTPYRSMFTVYHHAHMTPVDIWTPPRWSWPPTEQTRWTLPCYVLVVWTERLSSPFPTAGRNVSFSPPSPVKWTSLRRSTWRTVSFWFNSSMIKWPLLFCC